MGRGDRACRTESRHFDRTRRAREIQVSGQPALLRGTLRCRRSQRPSSSGDGAARNRPRIGRRAGRYERHVVRVVGAWTRDRDGDRGGPVPAGRSRIEARLPCSQVPLGRLTPTAHNCQSRAPHSIRDPSRTRAPNIERRMTASTVRRPAPNGALAQVRESSLAFGTDHACRALGMFSTRVDAGWSGGPNPSAVRRAPGPHRAPTARPRSRPRGPPAKAAWLCR